MARIVKFEWKIILALLVTAAAPLIFTILIVERLVEESMAVGLNQQVMTGLMDGVDLYKEVIESRIRIARLQGRSLAEDESFQRAIVEGEVDKVQERLENLISENGSISAARVIAAEGVMIEEASPRSFPEEEWKTKIENWDLPDGHRLELTSVISKAFLSASDNLRDLVVTLENVQKNFHPWKLAYYRLFLFIYIWILVSAFVLGVILSRSVTRRVAKLVLATQRAAQGDLGARVPVKGKDEIGSLSESFNLMMDEIQRGRDRIIYLEKVSAWQEIARRLAHEIKNPLTPIQLAVQELHRSYRGDDPGFTAKLKDSAEIVEEEVGTLRRLVETFSEFAKLPDVHPVSLELNDFVAEFLKHNPQITEQVEFEPGPSVRVSLDKTLMKRVMINLVNNGLEAGDPGKVKIHIRVTQGNDWGTIQVSDNGKGLCSEARERLFQPYFTTKAAGTGLGLAIVKKIVLQHGGEITVEDARPSGTVFKIRLRAENVDVQNQK